MPWMPETKINERKYTEMDIKTTRELKHHSAYIHRCLSAYIDRYLGMMYQAFKLDGLKCLLQLFAWISHTFTIGPGSAKVVV